MFLVTTADQRFWKKDEPLLFLGEWCRLFRDKDVWSTLDHEVLPYHWDDREKLYRDFRYLNSVYEARLRLVTRELNRFHGVCYSDRYWRILVGPWLLLFVEVLFDRYSSVLAAERHGLSVHTWIGDWPAGEWVPNDFRMFSDWIHEDLYNGFLYAEIIRRRNRIRYQRRKHGGSMSPSVVHPQRGSGSRWKTLVKRVARSPLLRSLAGRNQVIIVGSALSPLDQVRLHLALGQVPYFWEQEGHPQQDTVNLKSRSEIRIRSAGNSLTNSCSFESLLDELLPGQIPKAYLEGYSTMHERAVRKFPSKPRTILTAVGPYSYEEFKFWTAHQVESRGARLILEQHGGHYGSGWSAHEQHELKIADVYLTWGWEDDSGRTTPVPSGKLTRASLGVRPDPEGGLLLVSNSGARYSYFLMSGVIGPQTYAHIQDQAAFAHALSPGARDLLVHRLYPRDYGWNEEERYAEMVPEMTTYRGVDSLHRQLGQSRLFIGTCNATSFLESLAANYPTVLFWNPAHWELRDSARPYYEHLARVDILHDSPESAAAHVNSIYRNPMTWWREPGVQQARTHFCARFARTDRNWSRAWKDCLVQ